ncbi:RES family NAD+ phosphorylase [uncultured Azohydromonas sp.]|uniref:RES family NAD+ phosphorylase n=1 Tax=uncultured Azohydromonas sp. TaxID=487342 RepID=UPI00261605D4|nr:RES family NAD+ phosphorylase [uncultured Azohydromonas sp.]
MIAACIEVPWRPSYRVIPSRFPPVSLFDDVASQDELDAVFAVQAYTNPRLRQELGELDLVPEGERVFGTGSTPVMAAFTYLNRGGSRFSDGTWGVYYAGESLETAIAEASFHAERFLGETRQPPIEVDYRACVAHIVQPMHDIRGEPWAPAHDPHGYAASKQLAREYRAAGSWGLLYRSVRREGGECVAVFRPKAVQIPVVQGAHVSLVWDGQAISGWYRKSDHHPLPGNR